MLILQFNPYSTLTIAVPLGMFFQVSKFSIHLSYSTFQALSGIIILAKGILKEQSLMHIYLEGAGGEGGGRVERDGEDM